MKKTMSFGLPSIMAVVAIAALCSVLCAFFPQPVQAKSVEVPEGVSFNMSISMTDNLKNLIGKDVIIHLRSGKTLQGYVKAVGNGLVHLEKLAGRDFYDALVHIEDISAIEIKFRGLK